jgi:hypothetical protein
VAAPPPPTNPGKIRPLGHGKFVNIDGYSCDFRGRITETGRSKMLRSGGVITKIRHIAPDSSIVVITVKFIKAGIDYYHTCKIDNESNLIFERTPQLYLNMAALQTDFEQTIPEGEV